MNSSTRQKWLRRKRRIARRLSQRRWRSSPKPMFAARNSEYDLSDRTRAIACGGIGAVHLLARKVGLIDALDNAVRVLKVHLPYHESDHVLNIAYNILCGGNCLQDLELLRNDEAYLDALGASRIPDPTTAGDFCRRFESAGQVLRLMEAIAVLEPERNAILALDRLPNTYSVPAMYYGCGMRYFDRQEPTRWAVFYTPNSRRIVSSAR